MKVYLLIITAIVSGSIVSAQNIQRQVYSASGKTIEPVGISVSYTIGEPIIFTGESAGVLVFSGFENVDEETITGGSASIKNNELNLYPIPVQQKLTIQTEAVDWEKVEIISSNGEVVFSKLYESKLQQIDLGNLKPGVYTCRFIKNQHVSVYKITKL